MQLPHTDAAGQHERRAVRTAADYEFPAPAIEQMLGETERGYLEPPEVAR